MIGGGVSDTTVMVNDPVLALPEVSDAVHVAVVSIKNLFPRGLSAIF